jgi:hypothetical protein
VVQHGADRPDGQAVAAAAIADHLAPLLCRACRRIRRRWID